MNTTEYALSEGIRRVSSTCILNPKPSGPSRTDSNVVEFHQRVLDKDGNTLLERAVQHVYQVRDRLIRHVEIRNLTEDDKSLDQR